MIHPALILSMMGSSNNDENNNATQLQQPQQDMERAVANMEKAVATAAVVSMDQEVHPELQGEYVPDEQQQSTATTSTTVEPQQPVTCSHWIWMLFQFVYSIYMIFNGLYYDCHGIATLRTWSVVWGITTLLANVLVPLCHHHKENAGHHQNNNYHNDHHLGAGRHLLVSFLMLYIWGCSAIFAEIKPNQDVCHHNLYYPAFWSIVCGMAITVLMIFMGLVWTKCCNKKRPHYSSRQCPMRGAAS